MCARDVPGGSAPFVVDFVIDVGDGDGRVWRRSRLWKRVGAVDDDSTVADLLGRHARATTAPEGGKRDVSVVKYVAKR